MPCTSLFADFLDQRREKVIAEWLRRVRRDRRIPSADELASEELLDHLPSLLDTLIRQLRGSPVDAVMNTEHSHTHGQVRWSQQYRLDELLREVSVLRKVLIEELLQYCDNTKADLKFHLQASHLLHACLDSVISNSALGYVQKHHDEVQTANRSLEEVNLKVLQLNNQLLERDSRRLRMIRTITHEIANHLNAMGLRISLLKKAADQAARDSYTELLSKDTAAMTSLMRQLMEFATLASDGEHPQFERCPLRPLFDELVLYGREVARQKGLRFVEQFDPAIEEVVTDRRQLHRVCLNLLTNAIKYTAEGEVRLVFCSDSNNAWRVEVSDTGCGIAPEEQEQIFEEFYRAAAFRGSQPGVGLGLAITSRLVQLLHGRIELDSTPGAGATFRIILPQDQPAANA